MQTGRKDKLINHRIREGAEPGIFLTLQLPTQCMKSEASAAGIYEHPPLGYSYPCIQIVTIAEIVEQHKRLDVPMNLEVLQKAQTMTLNILPQELFIDHHFTDKKINHCLLRRAKIRYNVIANVSRADSQDNGAHTRAYLLKIRKVHNRAVV